MDSVVRLGPPLFDNDAITFGLLMAVLGVVFYASTKASCKGFFSYIPALLLCYFIPSLLTTAGLISPSWFDLEGGREAFNAAGITLPPDVTLAQLKETVIDENVDSDLIKPFIHASRIYFVASRFLLPACLVLLTLSVDLREIVRLGPKAI